MSDTALALFDLALLAGIAGLAVANKLTRLPMLAFLVEWFLGISAIAKAMHITL